MTLVQCPPPANLHELWVWRGGGGPRPLSRSGNLDGRTVPKPVHWTRQRCCCVAPEHPEQHRLSSAFMFLLWLRVSRYGAVTCNVSGMVTERFTSSNMFFRNSSSSDRDWQRFSRSTRIRVSASNCLLETACPSSACKQTFIQQLNKSFTLHNALHKQVIFDFALFKRQLCLDVSHTLASMDLTSPSSALRAAFWLKAVARAASLWFSWPSRVDALETAAARSPSFFFRLVEANSGGL